MHFSVLYALSSSCGGWGKYVRSTSELTTDTGHKCRIHELEGSDLFNLETNYWPKIESLHNSRGGAEGGGGGSTGLGSTCTKGGSFGQLSILFATAMGILPSGISPVISGLFDRFFAKIANTASTKDVAATAEKTATITGT